MVEVSLSSVVKRFDRTVAVAGVSLTAMSEQFLTLLGPSGCGKTTILRMIAGFERPDEGDIRFDGTTVLARPPERRGVGMVFQQYALFPHMNVWQNVAYGLRYRRIRGTADRIGNLMEMIGLTGLEKRKPDQLSAGQQQRVALARALAPQPKILLLDEPLSALDAKLRDALRFEIRRIQQALSLTTIYVTHDQAEALASSDRIAVMSMGRVEQVGPPHEVYLHPETRFAASFIGQTNRFEGEVSTATGDGIDVQVGSCSFRVASGNGEGASPGSPVLLFVKIEQMILDASRENAFAAEVVGVEYHGDTSIVQLHSPLGAHAVRMASDQARGLAIGEQRSVSFSPEDTFLFPV